MKAAADLLISSDSHVIEPEDLWQRELPESLRARAPRYPKHNFQGREGGTNPVKRIPEMAMDGVSGEVLYPSLSMDQFGIADVALQEACLRVYNDWLIEYCAHAPHRLFGVGAIPTWNIDHAVAEAHRCKDAGMRGLMIWQVPPKELSFATSHYDPFWSLAQELNMPVSLHILTGAPHGPGATAAIPIDITARFDHAVNLKLYYATEAIAQIISSGVLERFPRLKIVLVENEVSWLPFVLSQWDRYAATGRYKSTMTMPPSKYFERQVYATFFNDPPVRYLLDEWGADNCMWSNDFPHRNSTWPKSREVIARDMGHFPDALRRKLLSDNVARLYDLPVAKLMAAA